MKLLHLLSGVFDLTTFSSDRAPLDEYRSTWKSVSVSPSRGLLSPRSCEFRRKIPLVYDKIRKHRCITRRPNGCGLTIELGSSYPVGRFFTTLYLSRKIPTYEVTGKQRQGKKDNGRKSKPAPATQWWAIFLFLSYQGTNITLFISYEAIFASLSASKAG